MAIISTAEYKAYAGITDADWDTRIGILTPIGQGMLEEYCGRVFESATYTDVKFTGNGEQSLWIKNRPVTAVSAVKTVDSEGTSTTLEASTYRFSAEGELHRLSGSVSGWDRGWDYQRSIGTVGGIRSNVWSDDAPDNILISYTGGYTSLLMPDSLKGLMYLITDGLIDEAGENWKLAATGDGVISRTALAPDLITRRYADLCRPWRGSGLAVI